MPTSPQVPSGAATLGALLEQTATRHPDRVAWRFIEREESVTFAELLRYVNAAASGLRALGVVKGDHVAVMSTNRLAFLGAWLALARLGAVTVAVNTRYTPREVEYLVRDSEAGYLLVEARFLPVVEAIPSWPTLSSRERVMVIDESGEPDQSTRVGHDWQALVGSGDAAARFDEDVGPDDLVNIQYTSGTTGFPKGCMLTHRYWISSAEVTGCSLDFPLERVIYNQNFFYMDGPFLATMCLSAGATFFVVTTPSASKFIGWARELAIQYCFFFEALYKTDEAPDDCDNQFELIQTFGFNRNNHTDLERRFGSVAREAFGMTECGAGLQMPSAVTDMVGSGSCGVPVAHREATIMDDAGTPVGAGEVGELWLRGPGIMLGYYNNPEATAEVFSGEWFRTGDLFRQDERGYYYIVGRKKDMVRRNAENIACREVEEVLRALPLVREAAVVAVPDDAVGEEVKAYLQLQEGLDARDLSPEQVIAHCRERLASFKVPRYVEYRTSFPMTDSARVEKRKVTAESEDLRLNSYDRVEGGWR